MLTQTNLETNLERVHEWIKSADQKVSIFLAFQGVVLTLLFTNIYSWVVNNLTAFSIFNLIIFISGIVLIGYSFYKSTLAIVPCLIKDKKTKSITYFGDIAKSNINDFKKIIKKIDVEEYKNELVEQIYISSKIAVTKHSQFRDAIFTFYGGMALLIISFILIKIKI